MVCRVSKDRKQGEGRGTGLGGQEPGDRSWAAPARVSPALLPTDPWEELLKSR